MAWLSRIRCMVIAGVKRARSHARAGPPLTNLIPIVKLATRYMQEHGLSVMPNDKETGCSL
eukprot:3807592-Lingulodinium_polyedra.AAC.1